MRRGGRWRGADVLSVVRAAHVSPLLGALGHLPVRDDYVQVTASPSDCFFLARLSRGARMPSSFRVSRRPTIERVSAASETASCVGTPCVRPLRMATTGGNSAGQLGCPDLPNRTSQVSSGWQEGCPGRRMNQRRMRFLAAPQKKGGRPWRPVVAPKSVRGKVDRVPAGAGRAQRHDAQGLGTAGEHAKVTDQCVSQRQDPWFQLRRCPRERHRAGRSS